MTPITFRKRKTTTAATTATTLRQGGVGGENPGGLSEAEEESAMTLDELRVLQEFRAVGKRGISGDTPEEIDDTSHNKDGKSASGMGTTDTTAPGPMGTTSPDPEIPTSPAAPARSDVVNSVAIIQDSVHNTQTWKPILEEVNLNN